MNISQCIRDCERFGCGEIQVSRVSALNFTMKMIPNIPTTSYNSSQVVMNVIQGPCGLDTVPWRVQAGCKEQSTIANLTALGAKPDDYVCFTAAYFFTGALQATPPWTIVRDPEDPKFFHTCYMRTMKTQFLPHPPYDQPKPSWIAGDNCIDCKFWNDTATLPLETAPNWEKALIRNREGKCKPCTGLR